MVVAIHQPCYVPWLGYFHKLASCDLFVLLDHVQFTRQNFQNRNRLKLATGVAWVTVPVERGSIADRICDKRIAACDDWGRRTLLTLEHFYARAPHFARYRDELAAVYERRWELLVDLDVALLALCMRWLGIRTPMVRSSSLGVAGQKTAVIAAICERVGATTYLSGDGHSRVYLDVEALAARGIRVRWQGFNHPVYPQLFPKVGFQSHLSVLDLLFNCGPASREILLGAEAPALRAAR